MKKIAATLVILFSFTLAAAAADNAVQTQKTQETNFEQRKEMVLKKIDQRIARLQAAKACIQAAKSPEDTKACRERMHAERMEDRGQ
jgi:CHASE1-domain containing sensor protein